MNQLMPETCNIRPWNLRMRFAIFFRNIVCRFADASRVSRPAFLPSGGGRLNTPRGASVIPLGEHVSYSQGYRPHTPRGTRLILPRVQTSYSQGNHAQAPGWASRMPPKPLTTPVAKGTLCPRRHERCTALVIALTKTEFISTP